MPAVNKKAEPRGTGVTIDLSKVKVVERSEKTVPVHLGDDVWVTARCPSEPYIWKLMRGQVTDADLIADVFTGKDLDTVREFIADYPAQYETKLARTLGEVFSEEFEKLGANVGVNLTDWDPAAEGIISGITGK